MSELTAQQRAERCAQVMWDNDVASRDLGIELDSVSPGEAKAHLIVRPKHLNGLGICHGGFIFTLADTAFAFACNTYNQAAVAQQNSITYTNSGRSGARLMAHAKEVSKSGRSGVYDVTVTDELDVVVALFRGHSRTIRGTLFDENKNEKDGAQP